MALSRIKEYTTPRRKRLLVVEDNPAEQLSIRELLGYEDIDVELAATGSEALAALDDQAFDCVVLDLRLPDMSGFEILERFRDTPMLSHLPVVVFTGPPKGQGTAQGTAPGTAPGATQVASTDPKAAKPPKPDANSRTG